MRLSYLAILLLPLGLSGCLSYTEAPKPAPVYVTPPTTTSTTTTVVCTAGAPPPCN